LSLASWQARLKRTLHSEEIRFCPGTGFTDCRQHVVSGVSRRDGTAPDHMTR
ncbi:hypothetical protein RRG08_015518, partial [Elysia crispata]